MAFALLNASAWVDDYDFTTDTNKMSGDSMRDLQESTTFASGGWKTRNACLLDSSAHFEGFWSSTVDAEGFSDLGTVDRAVTVSPDGLAGSVAYMFQTTKFKYSTFGAVGDLIPYALDLAGSNSVGMVRGQVARAKGAVSATGVLGSVLNLGAPTSTQFVYAVVHVFPTAGTTMTIQLQSDDNAPFASPTTRATFPAITTTGGVWLTRVAGPFVGELYWRLNVSAITGTFTVAAAIGVQ